ncbi:2-hydroxy-3-oxopropionate reductase [Pengzhenrongella sp.]|uniref:2-hydroxy-3-oxopropionate reductase n=1 Tax=Pengzhenrongella sp. TaxID=2888820 RepID=UPI002F92B0C9
MSLTTHEHPYLSMADAQGSHELVLMKIGFIGLGIMGKPMATNLLAAGHELVVRDNNPASVAELTALGAREAATPKEVAEQVDLVLTMLPNSPHVQAVVLGADGILDGAHDNLAYIDMSSIAPLVSREVGAALGAKGIAMLDAPVSGGEPKAVDGTLSFMVGGPQDLFDTYRGVLEVMGASVVRVGELGAGNIAKLANQVVVALNIAAVSEALVFAQKAGVDPEAVFEAIRGGLAGSTVMEAKAPMMLDRNFAPGFRLSLHIKDLTNAIETGHEVGAPVPLTAAILEMMTALKVDGRELEDHSALVRFHEKLAGLELARGPITIAGGRLDLADESVA